MDSELVALIRLLDDPAPAIADSVNKRLLERGTEALPGLQEVWKKTLDPLLQNRLSELIQRIQFSSTFHELKKWKEGEQHDLLKASFYIAKNQHISLELTDLQKEINNIKNDLNDELLANLTPLEKIKLINHVLFDIHGFTRNTSNYYAAQNSYINDVLQQKKGNALSLGIVYLIIANSVGIPLYGVDFPVDFILAYVDAPTGNLALHEVREKDVLFYINPNLNGTVFGRRELDYHLTRNRFDRKIEYYHACGNIRTIELLISNLVNAYEQVAAIERAKNLKKLQKLFMHR